MFEVRPYLFGSDGVYFPFRWKRAVASFEMDINNSLKDALMTGLATVPLSNSLISN